jgi:hypothetical protein
LGLVRGQRTGRLVEQRRGLRDGRPAQPVAQRLAASRREEPDRLAVLARQRRDDGAQLEGDRAVRGPEHEPVRDHPVRPGQPGGQVALTDGGQHRDPGREQGDVHVAQPLGPCVQRGEVGHRPPAGRAVAQDRARVGQQAQLDVRGGVGCRADLPGDLAGLLPVAGEEQRVGQQHVHLGDRGGDRVRGAVEQGRRPRRRGRRRR